MTTELVIRGVPRALERDAWWFGAEAPAGTPHQPTRDAGIARRGGRPILILLALLALADALFWEHETGLSLAVFAMAVCTSVAIGKPARDVWRPMVLVGAAALPVIEYTQASSILFLVLGTVAAIAWIRSPGTHRFDDIAKRAARLVFAMPVRGLLDVRRSLRRANTLGTPDGNRAVAVLRNWGVPVGGTVILVSLLLDANPILDDWMTGAFDLNVNWSEAVVRGLFWSGVAIVLWPLVSITEVAPIRLPAVPTAGLPGRAGLNAASVLRALVMFNLVLGVQTVIDLAVLWGEGHLPKGMGYAEYAHRGAYPLLATALLAGVFALASRPFLDERPFLRALVLLWLAQNVALCISSAKRLDSYVDAFGLTYLRLYVMIWILVVAIGLGLTAWQIWKRRPNRWLLIRYILLGVAVLYAASFANFAHVIATHNLHTSDRPIDWAYLNQLPDIVDPTVRASGAFAALDERKRNLFDGPDAIRGWRDWSFRRWRVEANMAVVRSTEA